MTVLLRYFVSFTSCSHTRRPSSGLGSCLAKTDALLTTDPSLTRVGRACALPFSTRTQTYAYAWSPPEPRHARMHGLDKIRPPPRPSISEHPLACIQRRWPPESFRTEFLDSLQRLTGVQDNITGRSKMQDLLSALVYSLCARQFHAVVAWTGKLASWIHSGNTDRVLSSPALQRSR